MTRSLSIALALLGTAMFVHAADLAPAAATQQAKDSFPEYLRLLSIPNDAVSAEDIRKNVDWLETAFRKRGFVVKQLANDGKPMLFGESSDSDARRKTVLFYMHLDGMPVLPEQWAQKRPWIPVLKRRNASGQWEEIDLSLLSSPHFDPEWRVFGRSCADDKAPIMTFLAAVDALRKAGDRAAVNVKVLLDSEDERGSPSIGKVMHANLELLRCDAIVIHDGPMHATNQPTLVFGNRGAAQARLIVYGAKIALHSGYYGNYSPNPAQRLARLLAGMKGDDGRVTVPGYYDHVNITTADKAIMAAVPDDEAALKRRIGISRPDAIGSNYQESMQYPSLNVRGMASASVGDKVSNVVPDQATAELDLRTTPDSSAAYLGKQIQEYIRSQGYFLVDGPPTDEQRSRYDKLASFTYQSEGADAAATPIDSAVGRWAFHALTDTYGLSPAPIRMRMMGGTVPTAEIVEALRVPFAIVPLVNADNNQHTSNENMMLGNYVARIRTIHRC
jgi:acetylornithine deacetylase/succinyl-diaminopimelate desuccinylase-like protein